MKYYAPDYYDKFKCIAEKCRHSCCIGWEIDIDDDTLCLYDAIGGKTGEKLKSCIDRTGEYAHFITDEKGRCPFLNESNLCDLIINHGDGALCDICADHPRFRNFYTDRIEEGLGLTCEEAARIILTNSDKVEIKLTEDDGTTEKTDNSEKSFFALRGKIFEMLQNREVPVDMRLMGIVSALGVKLPKMDWSSIKRVYMSLERLESSWEFFINKLTDDIPDTVKNLETAYEQLLVYLIYRNLKAEDINGTMKFCAVSYLVIRRICDVMGGDIDVLSEICRRYSSEIEYSDENIERLIAEL